MIGFHPQGHTLGSGVPHDIFLIALHAGGNAVEHGVDTGVATTQTTEGQRSVGVGKRELLVVAVEPATGTGIGDDIAAVDAFHFGLEQVVEVGAADDAVQTFAFCFLEFLALLGELGDAGLVGVTADVAVGNAACHPNGTVFIFIFQFLGEVSLYGFGAFADELKNPHLVGVADAEALALAVVGIGAQETGKGENGLTGIAGTLEGEVDKAAVINTAFNLVRQLFATAVGGLADGQLALVHVAHHAVGVSHLRNLDEGRAAVPIDNLEHRASGIVGGATVVELTVERVAVGGVGDHGAAILGGTFGEKEIGAGIGGIGEKHRCSEKSCC